METEIVEIPSKSAIENRMKALVMKLILCPESFTLLELSELQTHLQNEGYY